MKQDNTNPEFFRFRIQMLGHMFALRKKRPFKVVRHYNGYHKEHGWPEGRFSIRRI